MFSGQGVTNTTVSTWFETQTQNDKTGKRSDTPKRRSTREQRKGGQGGGSEKREMWYVSRHDDLRTEVWRGCTPKVLKL